MMPIDLILVRHGESEGNVANNASKNEDNSFFTPEFLQRHSRTFRLTDKGISQARIAGQWLRKNVPMPFDRFYVSDYIRAKETAAYLNLPCAYWRAEFQLRERDHALMDNCPQDEKKKLFELETTQYNLDPFLAYPAGGGESLASMCLRLKAGFIEHLSRECSDKRVIVVSHGHVMRGFQLELENMGHDDFIRLDSSNEMVDKLRNCQILWYTRRDPGTGKVGSHSHLVAARSISPSENVDYGWRRLEKKFSSNEDLLAEVSKYPREISK